MSDRIDRGSRLISTAPSTVFRAFSSAEAMVAWLPPSGMTAEMLAFDFRDGGSYRMRLTYRDPAQTGKSGGNFDDVEVDLVSVVPDRRIVQRVTFDSDQPEFAGVMTMTWDFEPAGAGTRVSVRCENVPPGIDQTVHEGAIRSTLANLASFLAQSSPGAAERAP